MNKYEAYEIEKISGLEARRSRQIRRDPLSPYKRIVIIKKGKNDPTYQERRRGALYIEAMCKLLGIMAAPRLPWNI